MHESNLPPGTAYFDFTAELSRLTDLASRVVVGMQAANVPLALSEHEKFSTPRVYRTFALEALRYLGDLGAALLEANPAKVSLACDALAQSFTTAFSDCQPYFELTEPLTLLRAIDARATVMGHAGGSVNQSREVLAARDRDAQIHRQADELTHAWSARKSSW